LLTRKNRWLRFGYASVNFGEPVSVKQYCEDHRIDFSVLHKEERFRHVTSLAKSVMRHIATIIPVLPVALVSEVLVKNGSEWKSELDIKAQCAKRITQLKTMGAPINISSSAVESVLGTAMSALIGRGLVEEKDNLYRMNAAEFDIMNYYANSIIHWKSSHDEPAVEQ
jgi:glycerol-3-phosphate O-acyltransferase